MILLLPLILFLLIILLLLLLPSAADPSDPLAMSGTFGTMAAMSLLYYLPPGQLPARPRLRWCVNPFSHPRRDVDFGAGYHLNQGRAALHPNLRVSLSLAVRGLG